MILLLDTSTEICHLTLIDGDFRYDDEWVAGRTLAKGLLKYIEDQLVKNQKKWQDLTALGVFKGPGSFTGLRIGIAVLNAVANAQNIPIVGAIGENWQAEVIKKLNQGQNEKIVLPFYGSDAKITTPKK